MIAPVTIKRNSIYKGIPPFNISLSIKGSNQLPPVEVNVKEHPIF